MYRNKETLSRYERPMPSQRATMANSKTKQRPRILKYAIYVKYFHGRTNKYITGYSNKGERCHIINAVFSLFTVNARLCLSSVA